jgi:PAS domain S-box-containing protein
MQKSRLEQCRRFTSWDAPVKQTKKPAQGVQSWERAVLESLGDAVIVVSAKNRIEFMNRAAERLTGVVSAQGFGRSLTDVLRLVTSSGEDVRGDLVELAVLHGSSISLGRSLTLRSANGEERAVEGDVSPREIAGDPPGAVVTLRDVTERNRSDLARFRDQKVRAVAQLAGSIAHDLNNALTLILGHADELLRRIPAGEPAHATAISIRSAGEMAARITDQLRLLSRKEILLPTLMNVNRLIEASAEEMQAAAGGEIEIVRALAEDLGNVRADADQLRDMLINLVMHAREILPQGGRIGIETADVDIAGEERAGRTRRFIRLRLSYSGPAMKQEDGDRIFEPRFRASEGETQDLGIFIVLGAVSDAGGQINAHVQPGVGTVVEILLPRVQESHPIFANNEMAAEGHKPTILLVEDDPDVRALLSTYFDRSGYHLLEAENGEDALKVSEFYEGPIDLLITDVVMPVMSGPHLVQAIAVERPETRVLLISGLPPDSATLQDLTRRGVHFLQKPFRSADLLLRVQQVLKESRPRPN